MGRQRAPSRPQMRLAALPETRFNNWAGLLAAPSIVKESGHAILDKPAHQALPAVIGFTGTITGPIVGVKAMRRVGIDHDFRDTAGGFQGIAHFFHSVCRNAGIGTAVKAQHRHLQRGGNIDGMRGRHLGGRAHQAAVPRDRRLESWIVRRVHPGDASAPAETGDAHLVGIAAIFCRPLLAVVMVWALTGTTAAAKPPARAVITNSRREYSLLGANGSISGCMEFPPYGRAGRRRFARAISGAWWFAGMMNR